MLINVLFQSASITTLCDGIRAVSMDHPFSKTSAEKTVDLFAVAFDMFGNCHRASHCMSDKDIDELGNIPFTSV